MLAGCCQTRAMKPSERKAKLQHIKRDLGLIQSSLNECHAALQAHAERFKDERKEIFQEQRKQTKRAETTHLVLKVRLRVCKVVNVPVAEWRQVMAKGKSVQNAQATMNQANGRPSTTRNVKGQLSVFTNAIPKNRTNGWRIEDLMRHTHPAEFDLVKAVESEMEPIRKRIRTLALMGKKLALARFQHQRMLDNPSEKIQRTHSREKRSDVLFNASSDLVDLQGPDVSHKPAPPQLRKPR